MGTVHPGPPRDLVIFLRDAFGISDFIETGTYLGATAAWAAGHFVLVTSIEAAPALHRRAVDSHGHLANLRLLLGDSRVELPRVLGSTERPALLWLDGHWSAGATFGEGAECPLLEELRAVAAAPLEHFTLIDDARLFLAPPPPPHDPSQWPTLTEVLDALRARAPERAPFVVIIDDVLIAVPPSAQPLLREYLRRRSGPATQPRPAPERVLSPPELAAAGLWTPGQPLRLHLGCGEQSLPGYVNIDYPPEEHDLMRVRPDLAADLLQLRAAPGTVDQVRLHHVFEHFGRVTALALLIRWHGWLRPGGTLHIETPNLLGSARTLLSDCPYRVKAGVARHLAGDQAAPWAYHVDHWFPERFERTLTRLGFDIVSSSSESWAEPPFLSNVTVVARKARALSLAELVAAADEILLESTVAEAERPTWEMWRAQLRQELAGEPASRPAAGRRLPAPRIVGVVFSKDRPLQLDATLRSLQAHCRDPQEILLKVLFVASNERLRGLYGRLMAEHPLVHFIEEHAFRDDLLRAVAGAEHVLLLVDDTLFVAPFSIAEERAALEAHPDALGFSLRLGRNIIYCYTLDRLEPRPAFEELAAGILKYTWTTAGPTFGYPLEVSSSLYRAHDLLPLLAGFPYQNPNTLEARLAEAAARLGERMPALLCHDRSVAFSAPLNKVQQVYQNRAGQRPEHSPERLADLFARGVRVDVMAYAGFTPEATHQEVALLPMGPEPEEDHASRPVQALGRRLWALLQALGSVAAPRRGEL